MSKERGAKRYPQGTAHRYPSNAWWKALFGTQQDLRERTVSAKRTCGVCVRPASLETLIQGLRFVACIVAYLLASSYTCCDGRFRTRR